MITSYIRYIYIYTCINIYICDMYNVNLFHMYAHENNGKLTVKIRQFCRMNSH